MLEGTSLARIEERRPHRVLVVAAHMDDEVLGCGGTMLYHADRGDEVRVLILCDRWTDDEPDLETTRRLGASANRIGEMFGIRYAFSGLPDEHLEVAEAAGVIGEEMVDFNPEILYCPWLGDAHQDHRAGARATAVATRMVRPHGIRRVLHYEVLSATEQSGPGDPPFQPTVFVDIEPYLHQKMMMMAFYELEQGAYPHPRSNHAIVALAHARGCAVHINCAEAFVLRRELITNRRGGPGGLDE